MNGLKSVAENFPTENTAGAAGNFSSRWKEKLNAEREEEEPARYRRREATSRFFCEDHAAHSEARCQEIPDMNFLTDISNFSVYFVPVLI